MTDILGQSVSRVDARAKVTGEAKYPGDLTMEGMLYAKTLFAGRPHAGIYTGNGLTKYVSHAISSRRKPPRAVSIARTIL